MNTLSESTLVLELGMEEEGTADMVVCSEVMSAVLFDEDGELMTGDTRTDELVIGRESCGGCRVNMENLPKATVVACCSCRKNFPRDGPGQALCL